MIEILAALQDPNTSSEKIFSIKEVSKLFQVRLKLQQKFYLIFGIQYSVEADLKNAMLAILDLLKSSNKKPAIDDIYMLPEVSQLLQVLISNFQIFLWKFSKYFRNLRKKKNFLKKIWN